MNIKFTPVTREAELHTESPKPATNFLPQWYKHLHAFENNDPKAYENNRTKNTLKLCVPFADTLRFGYIQQTWQEINIQNTHDNALVFNFPTQPNIMAFRENTHLSKEFLHGYYGVEAIWQMPWIPKLPKGYSVLITHPLNREELPFRTLSGIIDADEYFHNPIANLPFLIKKDFVGTIPIGTPMYQVIPFKRDNWKSSNEKFDEIHYKNGRKITAMFWGGYKKLIWKKKTFT